MRLPSRIARPALAALLGVCVAVTAGAAQTSRSGLSATKTVLPNGLTVLPARYVRMVEAVTVADAPRVAGIYLGSPTIVSLGPQAH